VNTLFKIFSSSFSEEITDKSTGINNAKSILTLYAKQKENNITTDLIFTPTILCHFSHHPYSLVIRGTISVECKNDKITLTYDVFHPLHILAFSLLYLIPGTNESYMIFVPILLMIMYGYIKYNMHKEIFKKILNRKK